MGKRWNTLLGQALFYFIVKKRLIHMNRFFGVHLLYRFSGNVVG